MKWMFRIILVILLAFVMCCGIGYFLPASQIVETHISVDSYPDEVFTELSDLRGYPAWFHGLDAVDEGQVIFAGAERGIGQSAAWRQGHDNTEFGNLLIQQVQTDSFVALQYEQGAQTISLTYALQTDETDETVLLLARYEKPLGDFPYLSRLRGKLASGAIAKNLDISLQRLKVLTEITTNE